MKLVTVVLSGGAGTRRWPASRQAFPKPFMKLGGRPLLAQAIARGQACGTDELVVITNQDHLFLTRNLLEEFGDPPNAHFLLEPNGRNTGPAIAVAALYCEQHYGPDTVMLVLPADHLIPDTRAFVTCALDAAQLAEQGQLVVFGIHPTSPETGFGYIEAPQVGRSSQRGLRFVEKPDLAAAQEYVASGRHYWNSGMFCFSARTIVDAMKRHAPHMLDSARQVIKQSQTSGDATRFDTHLFGLQPDISIDYAVMERADNVSLVPARFSWSDVGSWPPDAQAQPPAASG